MVMRSRQAIYHGEAGDYFRYSNVAMPASIDQRVLTIEQEFQQQLINYLGRLSCSHLQHIQAYMYATADQSISIAIAVNPNNTLIGLDCVSKFADNSFLTSSSADSCSNIYENKGLYCNAYPQLNALELLAKHQADCQNFQRQHGAAQGIFENLTIVAQILDEYTIRQQTPTTDRNVFSRWIGGFRNPAKV
jgi:hypothetical protein